MNTNFAFFGTSTFSVTVLETLKEKGLIPSLMITVEDKPKGRKLVLTPPKTKVWADLEGIPTLQLKSLRTPEAEAEIRKYEGSGFDVFIVASYGKIIPDNILNIPKHKTLNIHPSLLPKLRGASPIQSAILQENETGVTIIRLDSEEDHGPILAQETTDIAWPPYASELEDVLARQGAELLTSILPEWINGNLPETEQEHEKKTLCGKFTKEDSLLDLSLSPDTNLRKIRAYHNAHFFDEGKRVVVKRARIENEVLVLEKVVPEGRKEMRYEDYLNGKKGLV